MTEYWERTQVIGTNEDGAYCENVLHRRGEDPMVMAFRRNRKLAGCNVVTISTEEAFLQIRDIQPAQRDRGAIPKERGIRYEEWEW
jgi:hypothetical protein